MWAKVLTGRYVVRAPFGGGAAATAGAWGAGWRGRCGKHRLQAMLIKVLEIRELPDDLAVTAKQVVLKLVPVIEAEAHAHTA
ncbi:MAG: hypothetical protein WDM77_05615 [Steroidobacteraceae bacterium]